MDQRRLSAIMFTDMVGYSALVQQDEGRALALLDRHNELQRGFFGRFGGTEIKTIGDAFLVSFDSSVEAVRCAVAIQTAIRERNAESPPADSFQVRIGIHVGDVVLRDGDVFGDGVNIAARLQPLAPPGGICCSEDVARQLQSTREASMQRVGRVPLKNISTPVVAYRVLLPGEAPRRSVPLLRRLPAAPRWAALLALLAVAGWGGYRAWLASAGAPRYPSERIAVLPFESISAADEDRYFADGITEELISTLARIGGLSVIARTSVAQFRAPDLDARTIARRLMVGSLLEGSVRVSGEQARITASLIDAASQNPLWSSEYDVELREVLTVQSRIAEAIAAELKVQLEAAEKARMAATGRRDHEALRRYFLGRAALNERTPASVQRSVELFDDAIARDPGFALPYAGLAEAYTLIGAAGYGSIPHQAAVERARSNALRALELDASLAEAHNSLAYVRFRLEWSFPAAEAGFVEAIELKPGYAKAHEWYGLFLALMGRHDEAIPEMQRALELDPLSLSVNTGLGRLLGFKGEHERSLEQFRRALRLDPDYAEAHFGMGMTYAYMGRLDRAIPALREALRLSGGRRIIEANLAFVLARAGRRDEALRVLHELERLEAAGEVSPYLVSIVYQGLGDLDRAFELLWRAVEAREGLLVYVKADPLLSLLWGDPRFTEVLRAIGFEG
jgi:adenylate cyclase